MTTQQETFEYTVEENENSLGNIGVNLDSNDNLNILNTIIREGNGKGYRTKESANEADLSEIDDGIPEIYQELEEEGTRSKKCIIVRSIREISPRRRIVHHIYQTILLPWERDMLHELNKSLMVDKSSGSHTIPTTSTSSTIINTQTDPADAADWISLHAESEELCEGLFGDQSSAQGGGVISQTISKKMKDDFYTLKSKGERGAYVIKMELYRTKDVAGLDRSQWWKKAELRTTFVTSSIVDPLMIQIKALEKKVVNHFSKIEKVKK